MGKLHANNGQTSEASTSNHYKGATVGPLKALEINHRQIQRSVNLKRKLDQVML